MFNIEKVSADISHPDILPSPKQPPRERQCHCGRGPIYADNMCRQCVRDANEKAATKKK